MKITRKKFGQHANGRQCYLWVLQAGEVTATFTDYGASWLSFLMPDSKGNSDDILLGCASFGPLTQKHPYFGAGIGRFGNRIAGGRFAIEGKSYQLPQNDGPNCLHGGYAGFDRRMWQTRAYKKKGWLYVSFSYLSADGEEGFPGNMDCTITYGLSQNAELSIEYAANVDAACPVNLTNHAYFNLKGQGRGNILDHELTLNSSHYLPVDNTAIPTGELQPVQGTAFDFRKGKAIGQDIEQTGAGYDHCFVVDGQAGELRNCAAVFERESGRSMIVLTSHPGVQLYTGNFLENAGKDGSFYGRHSGFCLETQHYPDSPNQPNFPSAIFGPDRPYSEKALFSFDW